MTILYNNLGIGGFLDLLFGQTGSLTKTYTLPATGASFVVETNLEMLDALGLASDPLDKLDSYNLVSQNGAGATSTTGSTAGGGTQTWGLQYGSLRIINEETPPLVGGLLKNDRLRFELNTGPGSAWKALAPGGTLTQTITISARENGGLLFLPNLDGDIGTTNDTFTFTLTFRKDATASPNPATSNGKDDDFRQIIGTSPPPNTKSLSFVKPNPFSANSFFSASNAAQGAKS